MKQKMLEPTKLESNDKVKKCWNLGNNRGMLEKWNFRGNIEDIWIYIYIYIYMVYIWIIYGYSMDNTNIYGRLIDGYIHIYIYIYVVYKFIYVEKLWKIYG